MAQVGAVAMLVVVALAADVLVAALYGDLSIRAGTRDAGTMPGMPVHQQLRP